MNPNMWVEGPRSEMFDFVCEFLGKREVKIVQRDKPVWSALEQ